MKITLLSICFMMMCSFGWAQDNTPPDLTKTQPGSTQVAKPANANKKDITVYPNPSNGIIHIILSGFKGMRIDLRIMNVIGNVVHREVVNDMQDRFTKTIDLTNYKNGLYYVKLQADDYSEIRKVIVN